MIKNKRDTIKTLNVLTAWLLTLTVILRANGMIVFPLRAIRNFALHAMAPEKPQKMVAMLIVMAVGAQDTPIKSTTALNG
jgi:hypothetical protein